MRFHEYRVAACFKQKIFGEKACHEGEALDIVATLLGHEPGKVEIEGVRNSILSSFSYFRASLDCCL